MGYLQAAELRMDKSHKMHDLQTPHRQDIIVSGAGQKRHCQQYRGDSVHVHVRSSNRHPKGVSGIDERGKIHG